VNIACLGWGSLVWSRRDLPCRGVWHLDGPFLPIEFSRVSSDDRVTLTITEGVPPARSLWTQLDCASLEESVRALALREGIGCPSTGEFPCSIAYWSKDNGASPHHEVDAVAAFSKRVGLDATVWTALKPGMSKKSRGEVPSQEQLAKHLRGLPSHALAQAEAYARNTPAPIDTPNRRFFQELFGWRPTDLAYSACGLASHLKCNKP